MDDIKRIKSGEEIINKKFLYAQAVFGEEEKQAVYKSMENGWLAAGPLVKRFEEKVAKYFGKKYGIAVNSGSSANLLALAALKLPKGSEVITPACTFSTTVSTILHNGLVPVFVDSVIGRYTIDEDLIEKAITKKTKVILVPQLVGGVCDMKKIKSIAKKHKLFLIDDSCDTFGPTLHDKPLGTYADASTTSFYGSHIITAMGFGGMILTDNEELKKKILVFRDWGRVGNDQEAFDKRFNFSIDNIPYDSKFLYEEWGYNLKMNEAAAAFGLEQLKRFPQFRKQRKENFTKLLDSLKEYEKWFYLPYVIPGADTNWLAFPLTIKKEAPFTRFDILQHLEDHGIQVRVLFSGNITRHPAYKNAPIKIKSSLKNADEIMAGGFLIGCHQGLTSKDVDYAINTFKKFFKNYE